MKNTGLIFFVRFFSEMISEAILRKLRNVSQGPLSIRFSGVCPDAIPKSPPTAHSFASLLMRNPGLTGRLHFVSAGFARMPYLKALPLRIRSLLS